MAKNKYPERTVERILEVAQDLFFTNGYDHTSIQDICTELNMTKGAIYHHFKSKREIYDAVIEKMVPYHQTPESDLKLKGDTGLDKLKNSLLAGSSAVEYQKIVFSAKSLIHNPQVIGEIYQSVFHELTPIVISLIEEGIEDGSITTKYPKELAEFIAIATNLWLGPRLAVYEEKELLNLLNFMRETCIHYGADVFDDIVMSSIIHLNKELR